MTPLGLYVQIPFCASKCTFCNFSSSVAPRALFEEYTLAVVREVSRVEPILSSAGARSEVLQRPVDTIYCGGGTPLLVGTERLQRIVAEIHRRFSVAADCEFTMEATPGSLAGGAIPALRRMGVNRLSIGAQSFVDREITSVGRLHSAQDTEDMMAQARQAGFDNISVDLIAGLPHQTQASWQYSLEALARIRPEHVSVYIFEIDEKSRLGSEVLKHGSLVSASSVPDEDFAAEAYEAARVHLKWLGYEQYEISNFALPGRESRHNLKYWRMEPYLGFGAGAHSFDGEHRWSNCLSAAEYTAALARGEIPMAEFQTLSPEQWIEEYFFTGLRQAAGVDWPRALEGKEAGETQRWQATIDSLLERGLLERRGKTVRLAEPAYLISNEVFQEFLP
jgi:oxygen-independent coproporphyrinogen-3 oxidase